jgi:YidC/Oxa1 family membrane protein insertase
MLVSANIFQPLITVFQSVITFFHNSVGISWGWSIVLLTICVRLVLLPLTIKQFGSMRKMQHLQPQMKALQAKYKDDKQRQQQEMMKFYKENEVNPLASCLPLAAQLPVFISLFYMLRKNLRVDICAPVQKAFQVKYAAQNHVSLHAAMSQTTPCGPHWPGAGFLFIKDITDQAHGLVLVVLLLLYVGTQLLSTLLMSAPTMDRSQRNMMMILPVAFVVFIIRFPAGLLVYWITTNTWTMGQQYTLKRLAGAPPIAPVMDTTPAAPAPKRGGGSGRGGSSSTSGNGQGPDDGGSGGGWLGARLRGRTSKPDSSDSGNSRSSTPRTPAVPPQRPRKKKKRSGRRR